MTDDDIDSAPHRQDPPELVFDDETEALDRFILILRSSKDVRDRGVIA
ncbi:hypothetical protein [Curtobacterium sp. Leaf261]|nr:hypothetical protein [Curtobacterium sp. Leaf261]